MKVGEWCLQRECHTVVCLVCRAAFDIVDDGVNGIISTPFRPKEMADRIQTLINDESRLVQMSSSAIEKVKDFNADKVADKWDALFGSLEE